MRIATFNVESFFERAKALDQVDWSVGEAALEGFQTLTELLAKPSYTPAVKKKILAELTSLGLKRSDDGSKYVLLRQNRGRLLTRHQDGTVEVTANGRADWIGWIELVKGPVNEQSTRNTARVLADLSADVQAFVEVENRIALKEFSDSLIPAEKGTAFDHLMLIDGNDPRGIDVAIGCRGNFALDTIRSHVDDASGNSLIFSRDCPEYDVLTPAGYHLLVLVNHLKSKGFGSQADNNARRKRQAQRVAEIYQQRRGEGATNIVVLGDFNDTWDSDPLSPLAATDLTPAAQHASFDDGGRPGTFGNCTASENFDHVLLSPEAYATITAGKIFRDGAWGGTNGDLWSHYDTITKAEEAASDHCAVWVELDLD